MLVAVPCAIIFSSFKSKPTMPLDVEVMWTSFFFIFGQHSTLFVPQWIRSIQSKIGKKWSKSMFKLLLYIPILWSYNHHYIIILEIILKSEILNAYFWTKIVHTVKWWCWWWCEKGHQYWWISSGGIRIIKDNDQKDSKPQQIYSKSVSTTWTLMCEYI